MTDKLPDVMTEQEWRQYIGTFNRKAPTGLRNAALFTLMREAGLRSCEVIGLKTSDLREETVDGCPVLALRLETTKGDKERMVYLNPEATALLQAWMDKRTALGLGRRKHVFTTLQGEQVKDSYLRELAARKGVVAGIGWRVHPHALRHTFATDLLEETGNLALVQDALGHASADTTRVYAKVRNSALARAMAKPKAQEAEQVPDLAAVLSGLSAEQKKALAAALLQDAGE